VTARRRLVLALKLAVTAGLVVWIFSRVELGSLADRLANADPIWIAVAFALAAVNVSLGALRWRLVLRALGTELPAGQAVRYYWSSLFFNSFLPTGVVGDALRGAWTARAADPARALTSVVLDRVTALLALVLVAAGALFLPAARALPAAEVIGAASLVLGVPAALLLAFPALLPRMLAWLGRTRLGARARGALPGAAAPATFVAPPWRPRIAALALGCLLHVLTIVTMATIARAAAVDVSLAILFAVVPAVLVSSFVPVSISGIGVRDAAMVELLGQAGIPASGALALSLPFLAITVGLSLVGGLVYLLGPRRAA
jgi:uncharacterized membrane protein YbhN (UPF0104 family)